MLQNRRVPRWRNQLGVLPLESASALVFLIPGIHFGETLQADLYFRSSQIAK